eukprot:TRINITY_DN4931_c1_g1_i1.p1 TRINITY_DN4931_c1_g1~~TRINITY_DN4931_c1_g1_i1.p1  ORF type:complete len:323 (+),score=70.92 TRINITY_DN4931_c1_g1_i1:233-1201(+)
MDTPSSKQRQRQQQQQLRSEFTKLLADGDAVLGGGAIDGQRHAQFVDTLRDAVLLKGLPDENQGELSQTKCSVRGMAWKVFLGVSSVDNEEYVRLVGMGKSRLYQKIRNDTFRTFKTNRHFLHRVPEDKLIRVLNAFINSLEPSSKLSYVQGMNVLCAPFLYIMPEVDAYFCFSRFIKVCCPLYAYETIKGAHAGVRLADACLNTIDPVLHAHLQSFTPQGQHAANFLLSPLLSFSGDTPPLEELLRLWDYILAFGAHMNVLITVARVLLIRDDLLGSMKPLNLIQKLPTLDAVVILSTTSGIVNQLPSSLYKTLAVHPFEE